MLVVTHFGLLVTVLIIDDYYYTAQQLVNLRKKILDRLPSPAKKLIRFWIVYAIARVFVVNQVVTKYQI